MGPYKAYTEQLARYLHGFDGVFFAPFDVCADSFTQMGSIAAEHEENCVNARNDETRLEAGLVIIKRLKFSQERGYCDHCKEHN